MTIPARILGIPNHYQSTYDDESAPDVVGSIFQNNPKGRTKEQIAQAIEDMGF